MSEKIKGFSIELDLDHMSVDRGLKGLKDSIKTVNSEMKRNMSAFDYGERSTKKYSTSLAGLNKKFELQKRVVSSAKAEYEKMVAEHGEGSKEAEKAAREYNNQAASLQNLERYIERTTQEMQEFERQQKIANSNWTKVGDVLNNTGDRLISVGEKTKKVGDGLTRNVSMPLGILGGIAIKTGSDFEAGMSRVGAVSGASAEDMVKLEAKAREMGKTTVFSATEASDAMYYMSLAGWDAQSSMDGLEGVMDLAAASGEDLASVADIVTDGLTAFGLEAEHSGRMADVLAAASSNANTDVKGLGQAFSYVAPVAGALGYTMEDTSKAIGLMANAGIKSSKAGTALRTMMTNLAKPTDAMQAAMTKYGISLTDSSGEMKTLDEVMLDLRKSLGGLDKDQQAAAASTIFGKEAMSGALAIVNASEEDYAKLTGAIRDSDGAAKDMADTMQDNLQGSMKELKSMAEDLFLTMYGNLKPALNDTVDGAKNLTQWFANLSPETQGLITKFGLLAFASGPVISGVGSLTKGLGHTFKAVGSVSKAIGVATNSGTLAAGLASLGPGAIAGLAIAGIGAVAYGMHKFKQKAEETEEVNLDLAQSFTKQALELEANVEVFDRLSAKANISNKELAELDDLNKRISKSSNPDEIDALQKAYDRLAEKSGLSKDELKELFEANGFIIEQAPNVAHAISEEGNAFVKSTEKVREYINTLIEMSLTELEGERSKALANEKKLREEITEETRKEGALREANGRLQEAYNGEVENTRDRIEEISQLIYDGNIAEEEKVMLKQEQAILVAQEKGDQEAIDALFSEGIEKNQELLQKQKEKVATLAEELEANQAIDGQIADVLLKQIGINEEGDKGLAKLDETIAKNENEIQQLDEKRLSAEGITEEEAKRYLELQNSNRELQATKEYLNEELGVYKDINSLADTKLGLMNQETESKVKSLASSVGIFNIEKDIIGQLDTKSSKLSEERQKLEANRKENGANKAEIDKQISSIDEKLGKQAQVKKEIMQELGIWDQVDQSIRDGINAEIKKGGAVDTTSSKLSSQGRNIDSNNKKTDIGIGKERERTAEAGKDVDKYVDVRDGGTVNDLNRRAEELKRKPVLTFDENRELQRLNRLAEERKRKPINSIDNNGSLATLNRKAASPVRKVINFVGGLMPKFADGTPLGGHKGGLAVVGDGGGRELITLPSGKMFLSPDTDTVLNLPRKTHVTPHRATERIMRSIPRYAEGTSNWQDSLRNSEFARLLALNNSTSKQEIIIRQNSKDEGTRLLIELLESNNQEVLEKLDLILEAIKESLSIDVDGKNIYDALSPHMAMAIKGRR